VYLIDSTTNSYSCVAGIISSTTITIANASVNAVSQYTIVFSSVNNLIAGSFIVIMIPNQLTPQTSTCNANVSNSGCSISSRNLTFILTSSLIGGSSISVVVTNILNQNSAATSSSFIIYTYYDSGYDSLVDNLLSGVTVTMTANQIAAATVAANSMVVGAITTYNFSISLKDPIPMGGYFKLGFPP
jgi:hypothetical protein